MADKWVEKSLGELIDIRHGFAFKGAFFRDEPSVDILLTPGNFAIGGGFKADKFKYYDGPVPEEYVLHEGDLIVTMTDLSKNADTLGYSALIPPSGGKRRYLHNQRLGKVVIQDKDLIDTRYLHYLMCSQEYRDEIVASATGTTVKHTSPKRIKQFRCKLAPISEQRAIAHILGTLDNKIELNRRMSETLEAIAQALFKTLFVDATAGGVPNGWTKGTVGEAFDITMGQSPPGESYNEIGEGLPFFQGRTDFGFRFPALRVYCTAPTRMANVGDTLVSVRAPVGDVNMASDKCCIGRGLAAVRHKTGSRSYTYYAMHALREDFNRFEAEGTVFGSMGKKDFHTISYIAPPEEKVKEFEGLVSPLDQLIENNESGVRTLAALRTLLLPRLISGELRVLEAKEVVKARR